MQNDIRRVRTVCECDEDNVTIGEVIAATLAFGLFVFILLVGAAALG